MLAACSTTLNETRSQLQQARQLAAAYGLPLATYEAGPSIVEAAAITGGSATPGAADRWGHWCWCASECGYMCLWQPSHATALSTAHLAVWPVQRSMPFRVARHHTAC
jgi:hypothetical protein